MYLNKNAWESVLAELRNNRSYNNYLTVGQAITDATNDIFGKPYLKIAVLRNFTIEPLMTVIQGEAALAGFYPLVYIGGFDTIAQDIMNPDSELEVFGPDVIIIAQWLDLLAPKLVSAFSTLSAEETDVEIDRVIRQIETYAANLRLRYGAPIIINNFPLPIYAAQGILDAQSEQGQYQKVLLLNQRLRELAQKWPEIYVIDFFGVFARVGSEQCFDSRYWHMAKAPLGRRVLCSLGHEYGKFIRALKAKVKKCLILDCDETLWGGIVGEGGLNGIKIGETYPGSAYLAFQNEILNLYHRGIILALCSKNNEQDVLEVLREHPNMLLREEHFALWEINWDDKATNIRRIAEKLNIGLDSMVFLDDSPFEINWIKDQLPEVEALLLPKETYNYKPFLCSLGFFDSLIVSDEDRNKTQMYKNEAKRSKMKDIARSLEDYLLSLQLEAEIGVPQPSQLARVAQLTQKTNQFNMTTLRYNENEINTLISDSNSDVYYIRVKDCIDDMGIVGTAVLRYAENEAIIENLLLSCRALGRGVEDALLAYLINSIKSVGYTKVRGTFRPTSKNTQVAGFYAKRGFDIISKNDEETLWGADIASLTVRCPAWIKVNPR